VPLEPPDQQHWQAAVRYVELGMFHDANDQLEKIDPFNRAGPEVLALYHGLKKWEPMREIAKRLAERVKADRAVAGRAFDAMEMRRLPLHKAFHDACSLRKPLAGVPDAKAQSSPIL
jgi:hypothetical protein